VTAVLCNACFFSVRLGKLLVAAVFRGLSGFLFAGRLALETHSFMTAELGNRYPCEIPRPFLGTGSAGEICEQSGAGTHAKPL